MDSQVEAKADPKRPYKVYALIAITFLTTFVAESAGHLPWWALALILSVVGGLSVYVTPNPINVKRSRTVMVGANDDPTLFD